jgi:hypothetical protein
LSPTLSRFAPSTGKFAVKRGSVKCSAEATSEAKDYPPFSNRAESLFRLCSHHAALNFKGAAKPCCFLRDKASGLGH